MQDTELPRPLKGEPGSRYVLHGMWQKREVWTSCFLDFPLFAGVGMLLESPSGMVFPKVRGFLGLLP